ncbi:hypothetical protein FIE12Z_1330 [Fusarium flagelliforme]|uniref:Rhodopsin domain-containing protein n=2 Tax=Fusarium flagelliforme TaxID=2675880 RepID=A0A395N273_9HYPO|nr:hypothetical protein FIE12Z_1330 [Fusarium flagelliforme]
MRFISKIIGFVPYGTDDTLILVAFPIVIASVVVAFVLTSKGLGLDIWHVRDENITAHYQLIIVFAFCYAMPLALTKLSILAFFLRVFPDPKFRRAVHITMGLIVVMTIGYGIVFVLQRKPLQMFWEGWKEKDPPGMMLDTNASAISHGSINVALDVWMMILPMTQLWKIGIKQKKKFGIIAMFSVGVFLTVVCAVRIPYVTNFETSKNSTADSVETIVLSVIESCVGVMVACMPGARQCVRDIIARVRRRRAEDGENRTGVFVDRSLATIVMTRQQTTYGTGSSDSGSMAKPYAVAETKQ